MYEPPNAPASIGGVLDDGFRLFRASFTKVVGLAILASFVGQISNLFMTGTMDADGIPQLGAPLLIVVLLVMLSSIIFYGAIVGRMHAVRTGTELTLSEAFGLGLACMMPLLICFICYALAILLGSILLLIPGIILSVSLMFAPYAIVIERAPAVGSLKQSHRLVWGNWWRTAAIIGIAGFIVMVAYVLVGFVAGMALVFNPEALNTGVSMIEAIVTSLLGGLVTPLFYAMTLAAYYDLRLRREGDDLAARIDAEPATA